MQVKTKAVRVKAMKHHLVVTVEQDFGASLRWTDVYVPYRLMNQQYRAIVEGLEDEALAHLRLLEDAEQGRLPGID